jgi:hypothetical protein
MSKLFSRNTVVAYTAVLFFFVLFLSSCKEPLIKDNSLVSGQDDLLNLSTLDSFTIYSKTIAEAPYATSGTNYGVLGVMDDPIFGKTTCGFYAQYRILNTVVDRGANLVIDSVVLSLVLDGKYGSNNKPINIIAYEMLEDMSVLRTYNTNESFFVKGTPLGTAYNVVPNINDSVKVVGVNNAPQIRVKLSNSLGARILGADSATLSNNDPNFLDFFKGIFVTASGTGNGVTYCSLLDSKFTIYYHNDANDSLQFNVGISTRSSRCNSFTHATTSIAQRAANSLLTSDSIVYAQSGAGSRIKLTLPFLSNLSPNIVINKAEIIVTIWNDDVTGSDSIFPMPSILSMKAITSTGGIEELANNSIEKAGLATSKSYTENGRNYTRYSFNISQRMQSLVKNPSLNYGFYITTSGAARAERLVLSNYPNDKSSKTLLKITYSKAD